MSPRIVMRLFSMAAIVAVILTRVAHGATLYWDANGTGTAGSGATPTGTWGTDVYWTTDSTGANVGSPTLTAATTSVDDVFFSAGADAVNAYTISLNGGTQTARLVTFEDGTATLNTGTLSLGTGGGITVSSTAVTGATISSNLTISGRQNFNVAAGEILTLDTGTFTRNAGSTLNISSTGTVTTTMTNLSSGSLVNGIIGPWASYGSGASTRYATIDGSNNIVAYTGGTAAATAANVTSTLGTVNYDVAGGGALGAGANINTLRYTAGGATISGALTTNGIMNVGGGTLVLSGAITSGTGEMVIHAASGGIQFTGTGLNNNGNMVTVTGSSNVQFNTVATPTVISGSGGLTMNGTGTINLGGATSNPTHTYTGTTTVNSGNIMLSSGTTNGTGSGNLTLNGGSVAAYFGNTYTWTGLGSGAGQIQIIGGSSGFTGQGGTGSTFRIGSAGSTLQWGSTFFNPTILVLQSNIASNTNGKGTLDNGIDLNGAVRTILSQQTTDNAANSGFTVSGVISNSSSVASGLTKTGVGNLILSGANTFNGVTLLSGGQLTLSNALALQNSVYDATNSLTGTASVGLRSTVATMTLGGLSGTKDFNSLFTSSNNTLLTGLTLNTGTGINVSYSGIIANSAATTSLTKTGLGTQTLSGANSYTGGTNVNAGTLIWSGANNLPSTGALSVAGGANFSLADGTARSTSTASLSLASGAILTFDWDGGAVDTLTSTAAATTVAGPIAIMINRPGAAPTGGPLTLVSSVSGGLNTATYYLANNSDYTATLVQSGTAVTIDSYAAASPLTNFYWTGNTLAGTSTSGVDNAWALSTGAVTNWSSTTTAYTATGLTPGSTANVIFATGQVGKAQQTTVLGANMTVNSVTIDDAVAVTIGGSNILTLMSTSGVAGTVASPGSAISVTLNAANPTISAPVALGANQTWNVASGKTLTVSGVVSGGFSLTKADAGTVLLTGTNTFSGNITISGGTLQLGTGGAAGGLLGSGNYSGNISNNGALLFDNNNNQILSGIISGSGTLQKAGSGTLFLTGNNTYTGKTTISALTAGGATLSVSSFNSVVGGTASSSLGAPTTVANGTITIGSTGNVRSNTLIYTGAGETTDRVIDVRFNNGNTQTLTANTTGGGLLKFTSGFTTSGGSNTPVLSLNGSGNAEIAGVLPILSIAATILNKSGTGTWTLSNTSNTFTNAIRFSDTTGSGGTLAYASAAGANTITFNQTTGSGTLSYTGSGMTMSGAITASALTSGTITFDASGSGAINYSNTASLGAAGSGNKNLILSGTNTGDNIFAGKWVNNTGGAATLAKQGAGRWILTNTNTYSGGTTIGNNTANAGILDVRASGALGTGAVSIVSNTGNGNLAQMVLNHATGITLANNFSTSGTNGVIVNQSGNNVISGNISLIGGGGNTAINSDGGSLTLSGGISINTANDRTLLLGGTAAGTVSGVISNGLSPQILSLTKSGSGTWALTNTNTYTGATTVSQGVLAVNGSITSAVTVATGATLQGSGTINSSVAINAGGTLAAGNSIESLATGDLTLAAAAILSYEMNNDAAASAAGDLTAVAGNLSIANAATILTLSELGAGSWTAGEKLTLIAYSGTWNNGLFSYNSSTLADDSTITFSGTQWTFNYNDTAAGTNYTGDLTGMTRYVTMTAIPEPGVAMLGGLSLLGLLLRRRRK